ncbi:hypothetical protein [Maribacter sp.]
MDIRAEFEKYSFDVVDKLFNEFDGDLSKMTVPEQEVVSRS